MVDISVFGISLSIAVMIIATAITAGFKEEISKKATGFAADIQITAVSGSHSLHNMSLISANQPFIEELKAMPEIKRVQQFCIKPGIMKGEGEIQGIVLKGICKDFEWDFFKNNLVAGSVFHLRDTVSNQIVMSRHTASLLQKDVGDEVLIYFVQQPPRARRMTIAGIYNTGLVELDKVYALVDMRMIQNLNGWEEDEISGFEIFIQDFKKIEQITYEVDFIAGFQLTQDGTFLNVQNIRKMYSQIFDWLSLQNINVIVILVLMAFVAAFNMISGLLIIILERTSTIGVLKAMGANNSFIRKIFRLQAWYFVMKGLIWGNVIALTLCYIQIRYGILSLDQESYFIDKVPIALNFWDIIMINIASSLFIQLMLMLPTLIISKISPEKTIRYR